jgi:hypothetical protein
MYIHNRNFSFNLNEGISSEELSDSELFELKDALIKISVDFYDDKVKEYSSSYGDWLVYHL